MSFDRYRERLSEALANVDDLTLSLLDISRVHAKLGDLTTVVPVASDGLPARESGEWASDKLFYVERFIDIFTGGMKDKWPRRVFVDVMSGPGRCIVPETGREFDGSPILALKSRTPFTDVILVEADNELVRALTIRTSASGLRPTPVIIPGDCNDAAVIDETFSERMSVCLPYAD